MEIRLSDPCMRAKPIVATPVELFTTYWFRTKSTVPEVKFTAHDVTFHLTHTASWMRCLSAWDILLPNRMNSPSTPLKRGSTLGNVARSPSVRKPWPGLASTPEAASTPELSGTDTVFGLLAGSYPSCREPSKYISNLTLDRTTTITCNLLERLKLLSAILELKTSAPATAITYKLRSM